MDDIRFKRTDYTKVSARPSPYVSRSGIRPAQRHPKPVYAVPAADEAMVISIHINLPDYNQWRATKFARQYPFFSIMIAFFGVLLFLGAIEGLIVLWHAIHKPKVLLEDIFNIGQVIKWI